MLFRMPQDCSHVKTFCAEVTEGIDLLLKTNMPWDPLIFILGLAEDSQGLSSTHRGAHTHTNAPPESNTDCQKDNTEAEILPP